MGDNSGSLLLANDLASRDAADENVADEAASEDFTEVELDATVHQQIGDALKT